MAKAPARRPNRPVIAQQVRREHEVRAKIVKVLTSEWSLSKKAADEAAFHLTDWFYDLRDLSNLYRRRRWSAKLARGIIVGFVIHVPAHLNAAHRIIMGDPMEDVFMLGSVKGTGIPRRKPGGPYPSEKKRIKKAARSRTPGKARQASDR